MYVKNIIKYENFILYSNFFTKIIELIFLSFSLLEELNAVQMSNKNNENSWENKVQCILLFFSYNITFYIIKRSSIKRFFIKFFLSIILCGLLKHISLFLTFEV